MTTSAPAVPTTVAIASRFSPVVGVRRPRGRQGRVSLSSLSRTTAAVTMPSIPPLRQVPVWSREPAASSLVRPGPVPVSIPGPVLVRSGPGPVRSWSGPGPVRPWSGPVRSWSGPALVQSWSGPGPVLVRSWSDPGPVLVLVRSWSGPVLVRSWSGPVLVRSWSGPVLVRSASVGRTVAYAYASDDDPELWRSRTGVREPRRNAWRLRASAAPRRGG